MRDKKKLAREIVVRFAEAGMTIRDAYSFIDLFLVPDALIPVLSVDLTPQLCSITASDIRTGRLKEVLT
jgi:hypothetical protein